MVPTEIASFSFYAALLVDFSRRAKLGRESPMRLKCDEPLRLLPPLPAKYLLHRGLQIVVPQATEYASKPGKRQLMRF